MKTGASLLLTFIVVACFLSGCFLAGGGKGVEEELAIAREAIGNRDYDLAARHAEIAQQKEWGNREAEIIIQYLPYGDNMLVAAFWEEDSEALRYLAGIVHDINTKDPRFEVPVLVLAAAWGHTDMVEILLEAGADPNYGAGKDGLTALMWACKNFDEQLEMVRLLLEAGAEVNVKSNYEETPLSIAEQYLNPNIVELLKEYGAVE